MDGKPLSILVNIVLSFNNTPMNLKRKKVISFMTKSLFCCLVCLCNILKFHLGVSTKTDQTNLKIWFLMKCQFSLVSSYKKIEYSSSVWFWIRKRNRIEPFIYIIDYV